MFIREVLILMRMPPGFLQGLYPPVGSTLSTSSLRNGTEVQAPMNGYQLIPVNTISNGAGSEDAAWLQGQTNCAKAQVSSNNFYHSPEYMALLHSTQPFYDYVSPMVNQTFSPAQTSYNNAYTIFDVLHVASIHNATFPSSDLLDEETLFQLQTLADSHEFGLAYNESDPIRAITGAVIAAEVITALSNTVASQGKSTKLTIQFGAYAGMLSLFGLANLTSASSDFYGVPDYASSLTWELITNSSIDPFPPTDEISVRFLFHNGTSSNSSEPIAYPLFGQSETVLPWSDFVTSMNKFSISGQRAWCDACGNSTGSCAPLSSSADSPSSDTSDSGGGMSKVVAGIVGAIVTLAVILLVEILAVLLGGLRVFSKRRLAGRETWSPNGSLAKA